MTEDADGSPPPHRGPPRWAQVVAGALAVVVVAVVVRWVTQDPVATTYYVSNAGQDNRSGRTPAEAWATLQQVQRATLPAGSVVRLARGSSFVGPWDVAASGTSDAEITIASYGEGPLPVVSGAQSCVSVTGSYVTVSEVHVDRCGYAGVEVRGDDVTVRAVEATGSVAGVVVGTGADRALVTRNRIADNTKMSVLTREPRTDDAGAFGVLLNGRNAEVSWNVISGHHAFSYDFGEDGAGVEVFNSTGNRVDHNQISGGSGVELGGPRSADNAFSYNLVTSDRPHSVGFVTRGSDDEFGPVKNTTVANTTIWLTGSSAQGLVCYGGCTKGLLTVRNTVVAASQAVYVDGPLVDQNNLFAGTVRGRVTSRVLSVADVGLSDPAAGDFVPTADSPAIDAGTEVDQPAAPVDAAGTRVTGPPDIGAFERP